MKKDSMDGKFIVMETQAFYKLLDEVTKRVTKLIQPKSQREKDWIDCNEAKELLCIKSTGKLNKLVREKQIKASQHGRTIVYSRKSILEFLERGIIS